MRKAIAIFFLQIIVAVSVQPAIALHFCEGELSHMALYLDDGTCCEGHEKSETDCCDNAKEPIQATDALCHSVMEDHSLCCSTSTLIIETDTFQTVKSPSTEVKKVQIQVTNFPIPALAPNIQGLHALGGLSYCSTTKDHYLNNADILTYICVFRN